jgi:serine/threonine-protein kinase HipA
MRRNAVSVFVAGCRSGVISRSDFEEDTFLFSYDVDCADERAVSLTMPVVPDQYDSMGFVHPIFEMNLPEGQLRHTLELMFSKVVRDFDSLSLLEIVGKSQIGRLRHASEGASQDDVPVESVDKLLTYSGAEDLFNDLMDRFAMYSGISGVQPKVLIRDEPQLLNKIANKCATHIVKSFNSKECPELAANEFFSMQAALYSGLPTAKVSLSDNRSMLVVERFDRTQTGDFLGFEDFCVLSGMRSGGRYSSSYEDLAKKVSIFVSPENHKAAMEQLFGTVALSSVIKNGDAHLKNFGVLYDKPGVNVRLAPVYDMLSTAPYMPNDVLALEIDGSKQFPTRKQLVQYARQSCGLSNRNTEMILAQVANGVEMALTEMQAYSEKNPDFQCMGKQLTKVFSKGLESLENTRAGGRISGGTEV